MYATVIKTAVWILIFVELWLLLQVPAVGDALFSFIVGGEVPGTSKILTLNEMILFLCGVFVLAVGVLFHRELNLLVGGIRRPQTKTAKTVAHAVVEAPKPRAGKPKRTRISRVKHKPIIAPLLRKAVPVLADLKTIGWYWLRAGLTRAQKAARYGAVTGSYYARKGWKAAAAQAKASWKWLRPRIERVDRWLARKLHQNDKTASVLSFGSEMAKTVKAWGAYVRVLKNRYLSPK